MIKLNNKNITYVALADSNNSLKAPKKIWYADSSNSVKLVYRRKDALIEGEDYEKYHWLKGDGTAHIYGIEYNLWNNHLQVQIGKIDNYATNGRYVKHTTTNGRLQVTVNSVGASYLQVIFRPNDSTQSHIADIVPYSSMPNTVDFDFYIDNGVNYCIRNNEILTGLSGNIESQWKITPYIHSAKMSYIREVLPDSTYKSNLIPCKLLKPVPKWLDANGIRRQVGECGMIDLVSGKFYGNVNSVGTFTVENYYERKEWLCGDGSAYIDTDIIVDVPTLYISTSFTKKVGGQNPLFGSRNYITSNGSQIWYLNSGQLRLDIITNGTNWIMVDSSNVQNINQLIVDCPNNVVSINGTDIPSEVDDLSIKTSIYTFKIFSLEILGYNASTSNKPYHGAFGNFILNDSTHSLNLIPCTLTMDLPASMDANGIARTKGTSGMWDLVSDKFYGNVANSGTFKAVNLAEGVDYEVHQWLHTEVDTNAVMCRLPTDSNVIEFKSKMIRGKNFHYFNTNGNYVYYCGSSLAKAIYDYNTNSVIYNSLSFITAGEEVAINCNDNKILIGGDEFPIYGYPITFIRIQVADSRGMETLTSSITVDGIERYIPVKLLRSIPSKYDANGIARQAGECGMYDTVNDLFYGNVASSGSFTVSDDN